MTEPRKPGAEEWIQDTFGTLGAQYVQLPEADRRDLAVVLDLVWNDVYRRQKELARENQQAAKKTT